MPANTRLHPECQEEGLGDYADPNLNQHARLSAHEMQLAALARTVGKQSHYRDADLAHSLVVGVGDLCEVSFPESGDEDSHGHEVQFAGLNAQAQARLHRPRARRLQAALARGVCMVSCRMQMADTVMSGDVQKALVQGPGTQ